MDERYAEMLRQLSLLSVDTGARANRYRGEGNGTVSTIYAEWSGTAELAHRILSLKSVRDNPEVKRLMEEVQG